MATYKSAYTGQQIDAGIGKANTALQEETYTGTITSVKMNGSTVSTSGEADLGTVITDISSKQDTLVSGTNIKTINNTSILGSGNITVEGGETSIFEGLTASFYGDSLTEVNSHYTKGYHSWIKDIIGLSSYNNYGGSGRTTAQVYNVFNSKSDTADILFVMCGVNDQTFSVPLGQWGDTDTTTTYGAFYCLCSAAKSKYPGKTIIFITPHYQTKYPHDLGVTSYEVGEAMKKTCDKFSIPCYDNRVMSGMYSTNLSVWTTDNCHWNNKGHEMVGKNIAKWLLDNQRYVVTSSLVLNSISASFNQGQNIVKTTDSLDSLKQYLTVTATYTNGTTSTVSSSDYTLSGTLTAGTSTITVTYGNKTTTFNVTVTEVVLSSIEATYTQTCTVYTTDSLDSLKSDLVVVAAYSDSSTTTLNSGDYTLSGTLTVGTSTITATYEGKIDTFSVTVSEPSTLSSINAVYTQTSTVYPNASLNDLKSDLVVTATYSDTTTRVVPSTDYTLSGALEVGTSTITVTYEGETDTFSVTVSAIPTVSSITATYTQGSQIVYPSSSLDILKSNLVVQAVYTDSSTVTIYDNDYILSGTLTEGTSSVLVTYGQLTTTFNVTVSAAPSWLDKKYTVTSNHSGTLHNTYVTDTWATNKKYIMTVNITPISPAVDDTRWDIGVTKSYWAATSTQLNIGISDSVQPNNKTANAFVRTNNQDGTITYTLTWNNTLANTAPYTKWIYSTKCAIGDSFILNSVSVADENGNELQGHNFGGFFIDDTYTVEDVS